jgi:hypothetical protein
MESRSNPGSGTNILDQFSVADPDPGSDAIYTVDGGIQDEKIRIRDKHLEFSIFVDQELQY